MTVLRLRFAKLLGVAILCAASAGAANITLGTFTFNSDQFGDTLGESDGGAFRTQNWLNVNNADPGNPGALTGANFDTGIANIGLGGAMPVYTIGYNTAIVNGTGVDLGIVSARFSQNDTFRLAVSTDGVTFTPTIDFGPGLAVATGENRTYFYGGGGPFGAELFVTSIDLSDFGLAAGASIQAIQITAFPEGDLIRVAGFAGGGTGVPEPNTLAMFGSGVLGLAYLVRRRRS